MQVYYQTGSLRVYWNLFHFQLVNTLYIMISRNFVRIALLIPVSPPYVRLDSLIDVSDVLVSRCL